jgi:hypothetical protein
MSLLTRAEVIIWPTNEQKQWPHGSVTGASNNSPQMVHRNAESRVRSPGAVLVGGKSDGSGTVEERSEFIECLG